MATILLKTIIFSFFWSIQAKEYEKCPQVHFTGRIGFNFVVFKGNVKTPTINSIFRTRSGAWTIGQTLTPTALNGSAFGMENDDWVVPLLERDGLLKIEKSNWYVVCSSSSPCKECVVARFCQDCQCQHIKMSASYNISLSRQLGKCCVRSKASYDQDIYYAPVSQVVRNELIRCRESDCQNQEKDPAQEFDSHPYKVSCWNYNHTVCYPNAGFAKCEFRSQLFLRTKELRSAHPQFNLPDIQLVDDLAGGSWRLDWPGDSMIYSRNYEIVVPYGKVSNLTTIQRICQTIADRQKTQASPVVRAQGPLQVTSSSNSVSSSLSGIAVSFAMLLLG